MMGEQNRLLRRNCIGNFKDLVKAVNLDTGSLYNTTYQLQTFPGAVYSTQQRRAETLILRR